MATAVTADAYLQQIHTARTLINTCFRRAHELLTVREANLLKELEDIQNNYEREGTSKQEELQDLEKSRQHLKNLLHDNDTLNKALAPINEKIERILKLSSAPRTIRLQWNAELDKDLQHTGELVTTTPTTVPQPVIPDYKNKSIPAISCCKVGKAPGELTYPRGIAIEPRTGRIYIADYDRVQVFTPNGEYCYKFSSMSVPWGICISNYTVYVSQYSGDCIVLYKLDGTYINKVGSRGTKNGQFVHPSGIAVNAATRYLYVCDYGNHRVQVFDQSMKFHAIFNENNVKNVKNPIDVNLTTDSVIVLDEGNPCVHIFSITNYSLLNSIISSEQIIRSFFFSMNAALNIIITDYHRHQVKVFSMAGDFITQFGTEGHNVGEFIEPTGITIDGQNRIVVVSQNKNAAIQIF